jgi:alanine dehydrogenase
MSVCHRTVSSYGTASNTLRASSTHTLLAGLSGSNALDAFVRMVEAGTVCPEATTLASVLPAVVEVADIATGRCVHGFGFKCRLTDHEHVVTGLISLYAKVWRYRMCMPSL